MTDFPFSHATVCQNSAMTASIMLPIETAARELDSKLLLAAVLASGGGSVILGSHARINTALHALPAKLYISQTIVKAKRRIFSIIRQSGMRLMAWDEEGLIWPNAEYYQRRRLDAENFARLEQFFAWGEEQAEVIRKTFPDQVEKLRVTGNPRQDLYHPAFRPLHDEAVRAIRREFGSIILVNSNFGSVNHARKPFTGLEKTEKEIRALAAYSKHEPEYIAYRYRVFRSFCALVPKLAEAFPGRTILIRPHPSENPAAWEEVARPFSNVVVRYDHELIPWLLAAEAVIHNGCTTALEAAMLERPAIEFRAVEDAAWENPQPSAVSIPARSVEDAVDLLRRPETLERERAQVERALRRMIAHWNEGFASERIARVLLEVANDSMIQPSDLTRFAARVRCRLRALEKHIVGRLMPWKSANPAYIGKKFPPMTIEEVRTRVDRLADLAGLPRPRIEELGDRIWRISPAVGKE